MMIQPYYLTHGVKLDSEHSTIQAARKRARDLIKHYGRNHFQIVIGYRNGSDSQELIIYRHKKEFVGKTDE